MQFCCILGCKNIGNHSIPKDQRRRQWQIAMRRNNITANSRICSDHFKPEDFMTESFYTGLPYAVKRLKKTAVPSVFAWTKESVLARQRRLRAEHRDSVRSLNKVNTVASMISVESPDIVEIDIAEEIELCTETSVVSENADHLVQSEPGTRDVGTLKRYQYLTTEDFTDDDEGIHYYTGLESFEKFNFVLSTLSPEVHSINYLRSQVINMSVQDQLLLTLIKLRRNKDDYELSRFFQVSRCSVSNIFITWINFMYQMWSMLNIWPSRELIDFYMPNGFKTHFPQTRVIVDCTEIPVQRPSNPVAQQAVWSSYKNRTTVKFEVGASPSGLLTHCSEAYGGSTSDRQMVERSGLVDKCEKGDSVMADRGFNVQDIFASKGISVNIPAFLKGKSQIPGLTVIKDRKLASKRIHIERMIGLTKTYHFLKEPVNIMYVPLMHKIYFVCQMLTNFKEGIVPKSS